MPYIPSRVRVALDANISQPATVGELNYKITKLILTYLGEDPGYYRYNAMIGVLECAKLELYRRQVALLEDEKKAENGDVYPSRGD